MDLGLLLDFRLDTVASCIENFWGDPNVQGLSVETTDFYISIHKATSTVELYFIPIIIYRNLVFYTNMGIPPSKLNYAQHRNMSTDSLNMRLMDSIIMQTAKAYFEKCCEEFFKKLNEVSLFLDD